MRYTAGIKPKPFLIACTFKYVDCSKVDDRVNTKLYNIVHIPAETVNAGEALRSRYQFNWEKEHLFQVWCTIRVFQQSSDVLLPGLMTVAKNHSENSIRQ